MLMNNVQPSNLYNSKKFTTFIETIDQIPDHRVDRNKLHSLTNIIVIIIFSMLGGANNPSEIKRFGDRHYKWFRSVLDLKHGIPSRPTISRMLGALDPMQLSYWLNFWRDQSCKKTDTEQIAIDGKEDNACGFECMRAYDVENGTVIAHAPVKKGTNEITTAPILLNQLNLENKIVSGDAILLQRKIVHLIVTKGGNYVLALKQNHGQLYQDVKLYLETIEQNPDLKGTYKKYETWEKGHGRIEHRTIVTTNAIQWLEQRYKWKKLRSISVVTRTRIFKDRIETAQNLYLSDLDNDPIKIYNAVRKHWFIENLCHRDLDMNFDSDRSTSRGGNSAFNLSIIKDFVLGLLKQSDPERPVKEKRLDNAHSFSNLLKTLLNR
jgi:predicted transposase YbfD/YdcC